MVRRSDVFLLLMLLLIGVAYQLVFLRFGVGLIDEGHLANAARRIAVGGNRSHPDHINLVFPQTA